ncbi:MAG: hypothetical protein FJ146_05830 [Deltaproteobacteria bacterium]|nr:hypothetical protein [Deltaproteobacteria bacterium]
MKTGLLVTVAVLALVSCGRAPQGATVKAVAGAEASLHVEKFSGTNEQGGGCSVAISYDTQGEVKGIVLNGTYTVDYKIPAPLSGLYGKYFYPGAFDAATSIKSGDLKISHAWFGSDVVLEGHGKPLFWDTPDTHHKVTIKGDSLTPEAVSYYTIQRIAGVVPFVETSLECANLSK